MNQFETILEILIRLEKNLNDTGKKILTFEEFCNYAGISKSHGYKLTSSNQIPFYRPHGKLIYVEKSEADKWLLQNRVKSVSEIKAEQDSK